MVGEPKYPPEQIYWILDNVLKKTKTEDMSAGFNAIFGKSLSHTQIRYVKNKYGKDPDFNAPLINKRLEWKGPGPLRPLAGQPSRNHLTEPVVFTPTQILSPCPHASQPISGPSYSSLATAPIPEQALANPFAQLDSRRHDNTWEVPTELGQISEWPQHSFAPVDLHITGEQSFCCADSSAVAPRQDEAEPSASTMPRLQPTSPVLEASKESKRIRPAQREATVTPPLAKRIKVEPDSNPVTVKSRQCAGKKKQSTETALQQPQQQEATYVPVTPRNPDSGSPRVAKVTAVGDDGDELTVGK